VLAAAEFVQDGSLADTTIAGGATSASQIMIAPRESLARDSRRHEFSIVRVELAKPSASFQTRLGRTAGDSYTGDDSDATVQGDTTTVLWGHSDTLICSNSRTVIWGDTDTVIWGDSRTVIWGDTDTVIWGDSRTVIWGDTDTVIWGDSRTVIWGDSDTVIWGD